MDQVAEPQKPGVERAGFTDCLTFEYPFKAGDLLFEGFDNCLQRLILRNGRFRSHPYLKLVETQRWTDQDQIESESLANHELVSQLPANGVNVEFDLRLKKYAGTGTIIIGPGIRPVKDIERIEGGQVNAAGSKMPVLLLQVKTIIEGQVEAWITTCFFYAEAVQVYGYYIW